MHRVLERFSCRPVGYPVNNIGFGCLVMEDIAVLVFFIDPLTALPHDVDVKALTRLATLYDVAFACNRATADAVMHALQAEPH